MSIVLEVPRDLAPRTLAYRDELPQVIATTIQECSNHWQRGDASKALQCAGNAQSLAEAQNHPVSEGVAYLWLADLYREMDQLGPALAACRRAVNALRLQPKYDHRDHSEAVVQYMQGLLHHGLGADTEALADYQRALISFERALKHWESKSARNPAQAAKCEKALKWISVLCHCLTSDLAPASGRNEVQIPIKNGQGYQLVRMQLAAYVVPPEVIIDDQRYRLHHPEESDASNDEDHLVIRWDDRYFAVSVPEDQWAGESSEEGDYVLVKQVRQVTQREVTGVLWDDEQQQWKYGTFVRDPDAGQIRFRHLPPIVIGGARREAAIKEEPIEDQDIGIVRALLKPMSPSELTASSPPAKTSPPPPESSDDPIECYNKLLSMVGGNRETAHGLVEYERKQAPDAALSQLIDRAIARLIHDRR
jgi:tetratricopeptide (TPR) repeat protein